MKGFDPKTKSRRFGIKSIRVSSQDQAAMMISREQISDKHPTARCIVRAENNFKFVNILIQKNVPYILMDCLRAMEQNDAREVFIFNGFKIK